MQLRFNQLPPLAILAVLIFLYLGCGGIAQPQKPEPNAAFKTLMGSNKASFGYDSLSMVKARAYYDSAFNAIPDPNLADRIIYLVTYASMYYYAGYYNKAIQCNDSIITLIRQSDHPEDYNLQYINACFTKGDNYLKMGLFRQAYEQFYEAKKGIERDADPCIESHYNYRVAMALYRQGNMEEAIQYFQGARDKSNSCTSSSGASYRQQEFLNNIALCYYNLGYNDSALLYYNQALQFIESYKGRFNKEYLIETASGVVYGNLGKVFHRMGNYAKAEEMLQKNIALNLRSEGDQRDAQISMLELARVYRSQHRKKEMWEQLNKVRASFDSIHNRVTENEWRRTMWQVYNEEKNHELSFKYLFEYVAEKDSIYQYASKERAGDIMEQFSMLENKTQNQVLRKDVDQKQFMVMVVVIFSVMLLFIIALVYINYTRSRRNVKMLTELNTQVNAQKIQLEQTLAELELRDKEKDRIMRVVVHDLRNPISGILSLSTIMLDDIGQKENPYKEFIQLIQTSCSNSLLLISEILEVATRNVTAPLVKESVEMNHFLNDCIELLRYRVEEKKQKIELKPLPEALYIPVNKEKMWRVINNLLVNAMKFSPENTVIRIEAEKKENSLIIGVHDQGIGIPAELHTKVFDTFTSAKRPGTAGEKPFGLGLSISRQIVEDHGGRIWLNSAEGAGTSFFIELPLQ